MAKHLSSISTGTRASAKALRRLVASLGRWAALAAQALDHGVPA